MYLPAHFQESRVEVLHDFVARHPLATLVANTAQGLTASYLPMLWLAAPDGNDGASGMGVLRGHIARANPLWRQVEQGARVLTLFSGAQHYISPNWYPSKHVDGRVVPTWNYATVQIHGTVRFIDDTLWLRSLVEELTCVHERSQPVAWQLGDAPSEYIETMLRAIVGIEIAVTAVDGKFKGSQNRAVADREGVATALETKGVAAASLAELVPGRTP